jgi:hypothetical protein
LILVNEAQNSVDESLILVNEAQNSVDESLILVNEAQNSVDESLILVNEAQNSVDEPLILVNQAQNSVYPPQRLLKLHLTRDLQVLEQKAHQQQTEKFLDFQSVESFRGGDASCLRRETRLQHWLMNA